MRDELERLQKPAKAIMKLVCQDPKISEAELTCEKGVEVGKLLDRCGAVIREMKQNELGLSKTIEECRFKEEERTIELTKELDELRQREQSDQNYS